VPGSGTVDEALTTLEGLREQLTRGEFETSEEFATRESLVREQIGALVSRVYTGTGPVTFDRYDADQQTLPARLSLSGFDQRLILRVPPPQARLLREGQGA